MKVNRVPLPIFPFRPMRVIGSTEKLATGGAQNGVGEGVGAGVGVGTGGADASGVGVGTGVGVGRGSGVQPGVGAGVGVSPEMFGRTAIWAEAVAVVSKAWPPVKEARSGVRSWTCPTTVTWTMCPRPSVQVPSWWWWWMW